MRRQGLEDRRKILGITFLMFVARKPVHSFEFDVDLSVLSTCCQGLSVHSASGLRASVCSD